MPQLERLHKIVGHLKTLTKAGLPTLLTAFQRGEYTTIPGTVVFFATPGAFVIRLPDPLSFRQYGSGSAVACELASGWTMRLSRAHVVSAWPGCPSSTVRGVPFWLSPQTYVRLLPSGRNLDLCCLGMNAKVASTEVSAARVSV